MNSHNFNYLVDNWKAFAAVQGKEVVDQKIAGVFRKMTGYCLRGYYQKTFGYNKEDFARYRRQIKRTRVPDKADLMVMMDIAEAACKTDSGRVVDLLADNELANSKAKTSISCLISCGSYPLIKERISPLDGG